MTDNTLSAFLTSIDASLDQQQHCYIDNSPLLPADNLIAPLSHYGLLNIHGPDSAKFLQGQTSCNLNEVDDNNSRPGTYCTAKGRMITSFQLARSSTENYYLRMRRPLVSSSQALLAKYIVFSKAEQYDASNDFLLLGLYGSHAKQAIFNSFGSNPEGLNRSVIKDGNIAIQLDEAGNCYECWIQNAAMTALWPTLSKGLMLQGSKSWELLMIRRGQADVSEATVEMFIPQMLNYHLNGGVSFNKGCYTGQEVIARMQYKGKLKRQLYRVLIDAADTVPGDDLYRAAGEQSIGNIVNVVSRDNHSSEALAVITIKDVDNGAAITGRNTAKVEVLSLPYAITN